MIAPSHSVCAEGGTAAVMRTEEGDSSDLHEWDTNKGSDFLADQDVVARFVATSPDEVRLLEHWGVPWSRREDGRIMQRNIIRDEAELVNRKGEFYQSPEDLEAYLQFTYCIKCGCCMGACPTLATDVHYLGPMPLTALQRYNEDSRDEGFAVRSKIAGGDGGAFRCHYAGECSRVCPN